MKWERGKKGKKEAYSTNTKARYIFSEDTLTIRFSTGECRILGTQITLEEAKNAAEKFEIELMGKEIARLNEHTIALDKANNRSELRSLFDELVVNNGGMRRVYTAYVNLKKSGMADIMIEAAMVNVSPVNREYLVKMFSMFHKEGFK